MAEKAEEAYKQKPVKIPATLVLLAGLAGVLLFQVFPTFSSFFMADDFRLLEFARDHESLLKISLSPSPWGFTTFLPNAFIWILYRMFGMEPKGYYVFNVLLHFCNAMLVYQLFRQMTARMSIAVGGFAIFLLHFIHFSDWGPVVWTSAFNQLIAAFFYLCSIILFIRYLNFDTKLSYAGALLCFVLALLSKETALSLPLLLLAWCLIGVLPKLERSWAKVAVFLAPFFGIWLLYLFYELIFQYSERYVQKGLYGFGPHMITNWKFFSNLVMPNPSSLPVQNYLLHTFPAWITSFFRLTVILVRLALLALCLVLWWKGPKRVRLWIAFSIITYLPFIGFGEEFAGPNRYFYLPAVGFSILVAEALLWLYNLLGQRTRTATARLSLVIIIIGLWGASLLATRTWQIQMQANSKIRQQVLDKVSDYISETETPITIVRLVSFPGKFMDLRRGIKVFHDIATTWEQARDQDEDRLSPDTLVVRFDRGDIIVQEP
jgi:hypothetical protein